MTLHALAWKERVRKLFHRAGIDRPVAYGVLSTLRSLAAGPVTVVLIAIHFTPEIQGYYFTFNALLAATVFAELGMSAVIISFASHEWSRLDLDEEGRMAGPCEARSRLVNLGRLAFGWYLTTAPLLICALIFGGKAFFGHRGAATEWLFPWLAFCLVSGANLLLIPPLALLEGCQQVRQVYGFRLVQGLCTTAVNWASIVLGAGLWTPALGGAASVASGLIFLGRYTAFFQPFLSPPPGPRIDWRRELWPMQWRVAVSWISGYFFFALFTPIAFRLLGPVTAGQVGMTLALVNGLGRIAETWTTTRIPTFGTLIARGDYAALDRLFFRLVTQTASVLVGGALLIEGGVWLLNALEHPLAGRLLSEIPTAVFLVATVAFQTLITPIGHYLRAHKREPLVLPALVGGMAVALSCWYLAQERGALGMATGYLGVVTVLVPWCLAIWQRFRQEWHADPGEGKGRGAP